MRIKKLNEVKGIRVKTIGDCTNFGGLDLVGNKLYTIKTARSNTVSYISEYPSYTSENGRTSHRYENCLNHGNDIAYHDGNIYVAPCSQFCEVVSTDTWTHRRIGSDVFVSAIAHYSGKKFIVLTESGGTTYKLALVKDTGGKLTLIDSWVVSNPMASEGYTVSQGMAYNKDQQEIYVVFTNVDYQRNVIIRSGVYANAPDAVFKSKKSTNGRYELEGIGFTKKGRMIIGSNMPSGKDCIFTSEVSTRTTAEDAMKA